MYKIFVLILFLKNITADEEESNEKYIDLLPEEEKQEFLNRIARRILEEIKSSYTPNESHADVTDDQLDAHDTYVQELFKEESKNLEAEKSRLNNIKTSENDRDDINIQNKEEYIDLTLREGQRLKRRNSDQDPQLTTISELPYDVIPVQTIYDHNEIDNDDKNKSIGALISAKDNITSINGNQENSTDKNEVITNHAYNMMTTGVIITRRNESFNNGKDIQDFKKSYENDKTIMTDMEPISFENILNTEQENINSTATDETSEGQMIWGSTKNIYAEDSSSDKSNKKTTIVDDITSSNEALTSLKLITNPVTDTEMDNLQSTSTSSYNDNVTPNESSINTRKKISDTIFQNETDSNREVYYSTQLTETIISTTENYATEINITSILNRTEDINYTFTKETYVSNNFAESNNVSIMNSPKPNDHIDVKFIHDKYMTKEKDNANKTILRVRPDILNQNEMDDSSMFQRLDENSQEVYEIYEVDSNTPHYISSGKKNIQEHPYYIPVYNFAPDGAYYKPYNKFGPNIEDSGENEIIYYRDLKDKRMDLPIARHRFSGYKKVNERLNHRDAKHLNKEHIKKLTQFMKPISQTLKHNNVYYNPYDYPDIDYYFGRILRRGDKDDDDNMDDSYTNYKYFPDSNEPDHPFSSIHNSQNVKDHVRAIRKLLYLQKIFGYVPEQDDKRGRKAYSNPKDRNNIFKINPGKSPLEESISMDYYFSRIDSNENVAHNRAVRDNKSDFKFINVNPNNLPLTPNPLNLRPFLETKRSKMKQKDLKRVSPAKSPKDTNMSNISVLRAMLIILSDYIRFDNEDLVNYNWLKSTVNIQAALRKLLDLISRIKAIDYIHPKDAELLKYILYLFQSSKSSKYGNDIEKDDKKTVNLEIQRVKEKRNKASFFPKSKRKEKIKQPIKLWKEFTNYIRSKENEVETKMQPIKLLQNFENFIQRLLFYLKDFHDTIKHIAMITSYKRQRWYQDLKDIFLKKANPRKLAQVMLHLSLSKLLDYVEEGAKNGVEENFRLYLKNNKEDVKRSKEESLFVFSVLDELERINIS